MTEHIEKKKRSTKNDVFAEEQKNIFDKLLNILNLKIDDSTSIITKSELFDKKNEIEGLYNDIKKYYLINVWRSIDASPEDNKYMCIIRRLLAHHGYSLTYKRICTTKDHAVILSIVYSIIKNKTE